MRESEDSVNCYGLFGRFVTSASDRDQLLDVLLQAAELLGEDSDCLQYVVGTSARDDEVVVSEIWTSKDAHDRALEPTNIRDLIMRARPLIRDMPGGTEYEVRGGKSLAVG